MQISFGVNDTANNARSQYKIGITVDSLTSRVVAGDIRAVARMCRLVDDRVGDYLTQLKELYAHTGHAWKIGITGNPGAGKSSITDKLIAHFRERNQRVAVLAVDPTSPYSGGAILGDRIRMQAHFNDSNVFIRSIATRGALGGVSRSALDIVRVMDAWGADVVLVETVGVGQDELEITRMADTTLVVTVPGLGDDIQAIKAGLIECADVFCVNKSDRDGADATVRDLEVMISLSGEVVHVGSHSHSHVAGVLDQENQQVAYEAGKWIPPVCKTIATRNHGFDVLIQKLEEHRTWLLNTNLGKKRQHGRLRESMQSQLRDALMERLMVDFSSAMDAIVHDVETHALDPYSAIEQLIQTNLSSRTQ